MIIMDETLREVECDSTRKEGQENRTGGTRLKGSWGMMEKEERHIQRQRMMQD